MAKGEIMTEAQIKRNAKHKEKREQEGFIQARVWIPNEKREELKSMAQKWRDEKS